ncbi:glucose-6-phosphate dehydrogenase [Chlorella sorokiniana]|uniref:Glucose-6-phosphate dehydrogenase n=1 Tax=Chlorella sorokiniana TaxID=3076 RepID=A0A2P6TKD5_CHLSO|nr:glucose-6-phosphate dehydrogenase [Chlorella sorokiniana]|eukprot:PRW44554.1 glucose-6-phosphate dehydrogenase [Chlorella sorokiniana]
MAAAGALGSSAALLSPSCLRLCFVTRHQAVSLEPLEAVLLKEAGEGSEGSATPSPVLRPSILAGAFVRVRFDDAYRLDRIASTQLTPDGRVAARLQVTGRSVALSSLSRGSPLEDDAAARPQQDAVQQELAALQGALAVEPPTCWEERQGGELGNALRKLDSDWKGRLGGHSLTDLLLAMAERGLLSVDLRKDPNSTGSSLNVYYSRAPARPPLPPVRRADSRRLAVDVPAGSRREALLVRAVEMSCPAGQERLIGNLGNALATLDSDWESRLGGHSLIDLLMEMSDRRLAGMEIRRDPRNQQQLVYYSRAGARPPLPAVRPPDTKAPPRPQPAALRSDTSQLVQDVPPGSSREALLVQAVAEQDSRKPGQLMSPANLGEILNRRDRGWKARLGGHKLNDHVWELHRRGFVRAEERTSATGQRNLFFTNLRC